MANCTVTLTVNTAAISEGVKYEPFPNQIIGGVAIDTTPVTAQASATTYTAVLIQEARYRVLSDRFPFLHNGTFRVPASGTANLSDLLEGYRAG